MRIPPPSIAVGTDIIALWRILRYTAPQHPLHRRTKHNLPRFLHHILTAPDYAFLEQRFPDWRTIADEPQSKRNALAAYVGGRWAAKEAAQKAWGADIVGMRDLVVETAEDGKVQVICLGERHEDNGIDAPSEGAETGKVTEQVGRLSISHDSNYAVATVVAEPLHEDIRSYLTLKTEEAKKKVLSENRVNRHTRPKDENDAEDGFDVDFDGDNAR